MPFPARVVPTRADIDDVFQESKANVLQKANVSNLIGLLNQLNSVSLHASEIFSDILATTEKTGTRIQTVSARLKAMESTIESTEALFVTNSPSYFYDHPYTEKEWQRRDPLRGLLFRRDRAQIEVDRRRDAGVPLPDLSALDGLSASGQCIKKFSDSTFFMNEWLEAEKKKMEEAKAKRKERKKKRRRKKREVKDKITGIERWVYDPITGKKVKQKAKEIKVETYALSDSNAATNLDFKSADQAAMDRTSGMSAVAQMAGNQRIKRGKSKARPSGDAAPGGGPPPNPMSGRSAGGGGPPPVPGQSASGGPPPAPSNPQGAGPGTVPPPVPGQNRSGPPPVPQHQQQEPRKLTPQEMAARSAASAAESGAYRPATTQPAESQPPRRPNPMAGARGGLMAAIQGGVNLRKASVVKREPKKLEGRDAMLAALRGGANLKKVEADEVNVKREEKVDQTIFAILNRRQFVADDDSDESGSSWETDSS